MAERMTRPSSGGLRSLSGGRSTLRSGSARLARRWLAAVALAPLAAIWAGCNEGWGTAPTTAASAIAVINPTAGNHVSGTVSFTAEYDGVHIRAQVTGLSEGDHGFHIHEFGDCSGADGKTAGGHFNPHGTAHGGPESAVRHVGDLGNITANSAGRATMDRLDAVIALEGDNNILGRAVIVHADPDDFTSQPTGNAGARIGCGVIGVQNTSG